MEKTPTGTEVLDGLLEGGYEPGIITAVYGPAGVGKTTACMLACLEAARLGRKSIFIDTENSFSPERLGQLAGGKQELVRSIMVLRPASFPEQIKLFKSLKEMISKRIGLVAVDTVSALYRAEAGKNHDIQGVNRGLNAVMGYLTDIVRAFSIPALVTTQVYSDFQKKDGLKMVGGDLVRIPSKCLVELQKYRSARKARLVSHRSLPEGREACFLITETGFEEAAILR